MRAVANCLSCDVTFMSAVAWYQHLEDVHRPSGELVCVLCGEPFPRALFSTHPCVGEVLDGSPRRHPSMNVEESEWNAPRTTHPSGASSPLVGGTRPVTRPPLYLVPPAPTEDNHRG